MITKEKMMPLMLKALPSFEATWQKFFNEWRDEKELPLYIALSALAQHLIKILSQHDADGLAQAFTVIEQWCVEGDNFVKEAVTVGLLEDLQNTALHTTTKPEQFRPLLQNESKKRWEELHSFWSQDELSIDEN